MQFSGSTAHLQTLIDVIPHQIFIKSREHRIVFLNNEACAFLGHPREVLLNHSIDGLYPADQVRRLHEADDRAFAGGLVDEREEQMTDGLGTIHCIIARKQLVVLDGCEYLVEVLSDMTAHRAAEARSRYLAFHDSLTGLANRWLFKERIEHALPQRSSRCALLLVDLDHFKQVNTSHGYRIGDELLIQFGQRLSGMVRACDTVARLGGNIFSLLLTDIDDAPSVEDICHRVLTAGSRAFDLLGVHLSVTASIGVALPQAAPIASTEIYRRAELALSRAKDGGRNCWRIYTDEFDRDFQRRQAIEADLRDSLASGTGIEIHYQPLAAMRSGEVTGFEALARWRHPTFGLVMPDDFIPTAEASGLIAAVGEAVLSQACNDAAGWEPPLRLSVNVSPMQFVQGDLVGVIEKVLEDSGLDPARLELEITEGVLIDDAVGTLAVLTRIRALGVNIVLDDFGTGFSSLGYLRHFPFDKVKIDKSFIADVINNREVASIVQAVVALGKSLNMAVVAEGVETTEQFELLRDLGCTQAQGYLISPPMPIASFVGSILARITARPSSLNEMPVRDINGISHSVAANLGSQRLPEKLDHVSERSRRFATGSVPGSV